MKMTLYNTDKNQKIEIYMIADGNGVDCSADLLDAGCRHYDHDIEAYPVSEFELASIFEYCYDWENYSTEYDDMFDREDDPEQRIFRYELLGD